MRNYEGFDELYMPFDALLFFGAEGNGDLYAFRILAGRADDLHDVFVMVQPRCSWTRKAACMSSLE